MNCQQIRFDATSGSITATATPCAGCFNGMRPETVGGNPTLVACPGHRSIVAAARITAAGIPGRFLAAAQKVTPKSKAQATAIEVLARAKGLSFDRPRVWVLQGPTGTGKSHLAARLAVTLIQHVPRLDALWVSAGDLFNGPEGRRRASDPWVSMAARRPLLVLDDLGLPDQSSWNREILDALVGCRYDRAPVPQVTIVTTNCLAEAKDGKRPPLLRERIGEWAAGRILDGAQIVTLDTESLRKPEP